jgi:hypothetical protein
MPISSFLSCMNRPKGSAPRELFLADRCAITMSRVRPSDREVSHRKSLIPCGYRAGWPYGGLVGALSGQTLRGSRIYGNLFWTIPAPGYCDRWKVRIARAILRTWLSGACPGTQNRKGKSAALSGRSDSPWGRQFYSRVQDWDLGDHLAPDSRQIALSSMHPR